MRVIKKHMKWRMALLGCLIGLVGIGLVPACEADRRAAVDGNMELSPASYNEDGAENKTPAAERLVVYNAALKLIVEIPDSANRALGAIARLNCGYPQSLSTTHSIIKVEAAKLDAALLAIEGLGLVEDKTISAEDVTDQYHDNEIRLANAEKSRDRYLELLKEAKNVSEILTVERELERLNGDIDRMKGYLKRTGNLLQYATINVNISERVKPGPIGYVFVGLYHGIKWLFVRN